MFYASFNIRRLSRLRRYSLFAAAIAIVLAIPILCASLPRTSDSDTETVSCADTAALGDVGGENDVHGDEYDGELVVPAHIRLDRLSISESFCKPLDSARVSSTFGYRQNPVTGKYSFHSGYDLAAPSGSPIYSMYGGVVSVASYDKNGYGNYIIVDHPFGVQTLYAHCSKLLCAVGDSVGKGDKIALVGSTGNSTGAHLHIEFRSGGQRYDPEWILGGVYG
ncbi:MAG: M23 family metallopeptidase [Clostridia bacterium]|nr:M23 family metallopeptidase [Clostridia bacterium]